MKRIAILIVLALVGLTSCKKDGIARNTPECVEKKITEFEPTACPEGAKVKEYTFQGKTVYVFDPGTCGADFTSEVIDEGCNTLGYLGGISGNTMINGEDFSKAKFVKNTWEK